MNGTKQKREDLQKKLDRIRRFLAQAPEGEAGELLSCLDELEREAGAQKYGLVFEEHRDQVEELLKTHAPVLTEDRDLFLDRGGRTNFLLEGDNLAALELLLKTHRGKIDLIYIDPPYNTGASAFRYGDDYASKKDTFSHSKWLSFMARRLRKARELLADTGCIMISINENEVFGLKLLCDQIFGESNYLTTFTVKVRHENRILKGDKDFHEVFEYLLFYRKSNKHKTSKRIVDNTSLDEYVWTLEELEPPCETVTMGGKRVDVFRPGQYALKKQAPSAQCFKKISIRGSIKEGNSSGRFFMKHLSGYLGKNLGYVYKVENMGSDGAGHRYFLIPEKESRKNGDYLQGVPLGRSDTREIPFANFLDFEAAFNNVGYEGGVEFRNGKKPIAFLQHCFEMGGLSTGRKTVLDFFAGSGSTGHALLEYNRTHGLEHRFLLCNSSENNICREVAYERLRGMIEQEGYAAGLKYCRIDFVPTAGRQREEYEAELERHVRELLELEQDCDLPGNGGEAAEALSRYYPKEDEA